MKVVNRQLSIMDKNAITFITFTKPPWQSYQMRGKKDTFSIGSRECVWMTLDQMNTDPRIREVNSDVVSAVKSVQ